METYVQKLEKALAELTGNAQDMLVRPDAEGVKQALGESIATAHALLEPGDS